MKARLLTRSEAAAYCGLSSAQFSNWVRSGIVSPAIPGTHRWDQAALDRDLDRHSGLTATSQLSALEQWKATRNARHA